MTMNVIPADVNYKFGESYLAAIVSMIPANLDPSRTIALMNRKATLDVWLKDHYGMSYGPGYSILAESYYNFGYAGVFVVFLWGVILGKLLFVGDLSEFSLNRMQLYTKLVLQYALFTFPRRPTIYFVNNLTYLVIVVFVVVYLLNSMNKKLRYGGLKG